jgi:hypothetical protein
MGAVADAKGRVNDRIGVHLDLNALYKQERFRVAYAELNGVADPAVIASVEASLTRVYAIQFEAAELLASVSAELAEVSGEFNG